MKSSDVGHARKKIGSPPSEPITSMLAPRWVVSESDGATGRAICCEVDRNRHSLPDGRSLCL